MARYTDPVCRLCRREGVKLYLKGERCYSPKCAIEKRNVPPGMHGAKRARRKPSDFQRQLREKQKVRRIYGVFERQFRRYFRQALKTKGLTGTTLLVLLERRLDNVIYRLGFASSRAQARQLVTHGHFTVNGKKVDIASYQVEPGDVIQVAENSRQLTYFKDLVEQGRRYAMPPKWLAVDMAALSGRVLAMPTREDIDPSINEQLIVEYYSR
ncbi:MAG: 30S ribosomal protein S4 [Anaerolineae bacterium]|nr:30S ribosomal protein S4 [Caldilineales bacterium]MCX7853541.1 30S ribosomal protein S4 [Caldilineales bacterium]MDW8270396.1 30S ribosomal protein S4 [Anaerolineae bacterium]